MNYLQVMIGIYITTMNILGFVFMGIDKQKAKNKKWRIKERTLFVIALLGGSIGSIIGMQVFRHKTKHKKFVIGMPFICIAQIVFVLLLLCYLKKSQLFVKNNEIQRTGFEMGTVVKQTIYGPDANETVEEVELLIHNLEEQQITWRNDTSQVAKINKALMTQNTVNIEDPVLTYLTNYLTIAQDSKGAIDPTIRPAANLWGIETDNPRVPKNDELELALSYIGYDKIQIQGKTLVSSAPGVSIDFGAVGKGIACDELAAYLSTTKTTGAVIAVGGSILVYGNKPDDNMWKVAIQDPRAENGSILGTIALNSNCIISTSGDYEKYFIQNGVRYHHILDPHTGKPAQNELMSVTVVSENGLQSDALSTACFVLGYEQGLALFQQYDAEAIFVTKDSGIYITKGLINRFELTNDNYHIME